MKLLAAMKLKRLDEWLQAIFEPLLEKLGLENLEINSLYIIYGLLTFIIYLLTFRAHAQARQAKKEGRELTEEQTDFLGWTTASCITLSVVAAILLLLPYFGF